MVNLFFHRRWFCDTVLVKQREFEMVHARIREIRKQKGLTLQQVADLAGTTAQTIGRLETGMRTLSLKWVNRIAKALDVEPSSLLTLPEKGDIEILGKVGKKGNVMLQNFGTVSLRLTGSQPVAVTITANMGEYRQGDSVVCEGVAANAIEGAVGRDCLIELEGGERCLAKLAYGSKKGVYSLFPVGGTGPVITDCKVVSAAPVITLIRTFEG